MHSSASEAANFPSTSSRSRNGSVRRISAVPWPSLLRPAPHRDGGKERDEHNRPYREVAAEGRDALGKELLDVEEPCGGDHEEKDHDDEGHRRAEIRAKLAPGHRPDAPHHRSPMVSRANICSSVACAGSIPRPRAISSGVPWATSLPAFMMRTLPAEGFHLLQDMRRENDGLLLPQAPDETADLHDLVGVEPEVGSSSTRTAGRGGWPGQDPRAGGSPWKAGGSRGRTPPRDRRWRVTISMRSRRSAPLRPRASATKPQVLPRPSCRRTEGAFSGRYPTDCRTRRGSPTTS